MVNETSVKVMLVAVVDRQRGAAYSQDGEMIPFGDSNLAMAGWYTEKKDLLTETGKKKLDSFYVE